jgi:hypothetical protein
MKATIDIPDDLYRRVKAKSAVELYRRWLEEDTPASDPAPAQWLEEWLRLADAASEDAPPGPTAREILEQDRNRLDRR